MDEVSNGPGPNVRDDLVSVLVEVEPFHLDRPFDYLLGDAPPDVDFGWRVEVNFAGRRCRALVTGRPAATEVPDSRLRPVRRVLGDYAWVTPAEFALVEWAARRWIAPRADVLRHALPGRARRVEESFVEDGLLPWSPSSATRPPATAASEVSDGWQRYAHGGADLWGNLHHGADARVWRPTPDEDVAARLAEAVGATLDGGRDALVVVPDAGSRVAARLVALVRAGNNLGRHEVVDVTGLSSGSAVTRAWLRARTAQARVVVGERRVAFWPLARPGLFVVLDEANPALKERRSPRHHAREAVLERARREHAVALLTAHVPSAATWALLRAGRLKGVTADRAVEVAAAPRVVIDDHHRVRLGRHGVAALREAVRAGSYGVVLAARRGEGRAMVCRSCGDRPTCPTCGSSLEGRARGLGCPTCGWSVKHRLCARCSGTEFVPLAAGTRRLAAELARTIDAPIAVLEGYDAKAPDPPAVLVITRGSVMDAAPGPVGAVVAGDVDSLMRRPSVDAPEDTLRLLMQLGSWLASGSGPLVVVTREPDAPAITALRRWDGGGFWREQAANRAPFPPARSTIAVTAPDGDVAAELAAELRAVGDTLVLGPVAGESGQRLLVLATDRQTVAAVLRARRTVLSADNVMLSVDVDPVDLT